MAKTRQTRAKAPVVAADPVKEAATAAASAEAMGAFGATEYRDADDMPENDVSLHSGLHDGHDAEAHHDGEVHDDLWPEVWTPPQQLAAPEPRPGFKQRWIRLSLLGKPDAENVKSQEHQGWRPRTLESVPEGDRKNYPTMKDPRTGGSMMINGDVVLCEMPKRLFDQMSAYFRNKREGQVNALVDQPLAGAAVKGGERHGFGRPHVAERHTDVRTDRIPIVAADR
jgi:hypothetical protein